jgi:tRNA(fMet)-specific endonuclease VapC
VRYLLDTNICIYIANSRSSRLRARFERLEQGDVGMSIVTWLELSYGVNKSRRKRLNAEKIEQLKDEIPVQPLDVSAGEFYGALRADLERRGAVIGSLDMLIAAHALALDLILVTNTVREFSRVKGLRIENWA